MSRKRDSTVEKAIASSPLSPVLVECFKKTVGDSWQKFARIHRLFKEQGKVVNVTDEETKLRIIGGKKNCILIQRSVLLRMRIPNQIFLAFLILVVKSAKEKMMNFLLKYLIAIIID